jgi:transcriptional regulatory protein LevR
MMNKNKYAEIKRISGCFSCIVDILLFSLFTQHALRQVTAERRARITIKGFNSRSIDCYLLPLITATKAETRNLTTVIHRLNFELVIVLEEAYKIGSSLHLLCIRRHVQNVWAKVTYVLVYS